MSDSLSLCDARHYNCATYYQHTPAPTSMPSTPQSVHASPTTAESKVNGYDDFPPPRTYPTSLPHRPAAAQDLVTAFLFEGSAAMQGRTYSPYPIYGTRSAEERLNAVRAAFADPLCVTTHPPVWTTRPSPDAHDFDTTVLESREQYWRRLARHYINQSATAQKPAPQLASTALEPEDAFYLIDLGRVVEQMARWRRALPMVRPYYAVKCNPNVALLRVLAALGAGFDCASRAEIELVVKNRLVSSMDDIIFANPCKQLGDVRAAQAAGVSYVTFDSVAELEKLARWMPHARALLRIATNDTAAVCAFSSKFGAPLEQVPSLLRAARALNVEIYGVSFHVGSGNDDAAAYVQAVRDAHRVFQHAADHGFNCTLLDLGGGYPGVDACERTSAATGTAAPNAFLGFDDIAAALRPVLQELFPDVTIIAEPGRFFTAATHALVMNVFGKRVLPCGLNDSAEYQYYVNDGLYHSFNCVLYDHAHPTLLLLDDGDGAAAAESPTTPSVEVTTTTRDALSDTVSWRRRHCPPRPLRLTTIFGPTCDSLDCILKKTPFPEMNLGDWLLVPDMGSYTTAAGCSFNGFATRRVEWISSVTI